MKQMDVEVIPKTVFHPYQIIYQTLSVKIMQILTTLLLNTLTLKELTSWEFGVIGIGTFWYVCLTTLLIECFLGAGVGGRDLLLRSGLPKLSASLKAISRWSTTLLSEWPLHTSGNRSKSISFASSFPLALSLLCSLME